MSKTLILTVGLPRSGKSTWARKFSDDHGIPIVCPDAVRYAIHGQRFIGLAEGFVWATARAMVRALFLAGHNAVIVDATNTTRKRRDEWRSEDWQTVCHVIDTPREECLRRATAENDEYIIPVIDRMAAQWEPLAEDESGVIPLGAMGTHSQGQCRDDDEGDLRAAMWTDEKSQRVQIELGKKIAWLAMTAEEAEGFGNLLLARAAELRKQGASS